MSQSSQKKLYQQKEQDVYFNDGREVALLHWVYERKDVGTLRGSPSAVLAAIDEYARGKKYLMNVGDDKGPIVTRLIEERKPSTMVELGGYVGYSSILFADAFRKAGGKRYFTLERNPEFAAVIMALVELAGLSDVVKVVVGSSEASIRRLAAEGVLSQVDMMFLDHWKPAYTTDLKLCEELGWIKPGTIITADNVIYPGNPPYLEYVRSSVADKRKAASKKQSYAETTSHFDAKTIGQYDRNKTYEEPNFDIVGVPDLIYESQLIDGFEPSGEPDGIEVTRCTGIEAKQ